MITGTPTMIYVDGFNLYYGALKGTPYKWLNFEALFARVFPKNRIVGIRYFTAPINALPSDPDQPLRQQRLFRALRTLPLLTIIEGHYLCHPKSMPLVNPPPGAKGFAQVLFTEEKGSDVNLASYLLLDGFKNAYDCAIVVSGDSVHEKNVRHGHISTLHIWPARRPLAAARADGVEMKLRPAKYAKHTKGKTKFFSRLFACLAGNITYDRLSAID